MGSGTQGENYEKTKHIAADGILFVHCECL